MTKWLICDWDEGIVSPGDSGDCQSVLGMMSICLGISPSRRDV